MIDRQTIYIHLLIAAITSTALYLSLIMLVDISPNTLLTDSIIAGIILSILLFLMNYIIRYTYINSLILPQRIVSYTALGITFIFCWLGVELALLYITIDQNEWLILSKTIPLRIFIALLIYFLAITLGMKYNNLSKELENVEEEETESEESIQNEVIEDSPIERIAVKSGQKIDVILVSDIIHLQAEGDYVMIHSTKGKFLKEQTMKSFENSLPTNKFVRVHRSSIVNVDFISQIELFDKQSQSMKLKNGAIVRISQSGYKALKSNLGL